MNRSVYIIVDEGMDRKIVAVGHLYGPKCFFQADDDIFAANMQVILRAHGMGLHFHEFDMVQTERLKINLVVTKLKC